MTLQDLLFPVNEDLNLAYAVAAAVTFGAFGWLFGRIVHHRSTRTEVHDALLRAARDIRVYAANRQGNAAGEFARRALEEAEYIVSHRASGNNHRLKPTGESRLRPADVPRSHKYKQIQARDELREAIRLLGSAGNHPDDTYVGPRNNAVHRRYSPNSQVLLTASRTRRRR